MPSIEEKFGTVRHNVGTQLPDVEKLENRRTTDSAVEALEAKIGDLMQELAERTRQVGLVKMVLEGAQEKVQELLQENQKLTMEKEKHEHIAQTDELTGLLNRQGFKAIAPTMFEMYLGLAREAGPRTGQRSGEKQKPRENRMDVSFNAIYIDLNGFKEINDTLEHAAGDQALKKVADALRSAVRKSDPIFRMGGDEFLVLFVSREDPESKKTVVEENRFIVAERIKKKLEATGFSFKGVKNTNSVEVPPLTAMIGVAQFVPREGEGLNEVIQAADAEALKLKDKKKVEKAAGIYEPKTEIAYAQEIK